MSCLPSPLQSLLRDDPPAIALDALVLEAIDQMAQIPGTEGLAVLDQGEVVGVFTPEDVVRLIAERRSLDGLLLRDVIQRSVITLLESDLADVTGTIAWLNQLNAPDPDLNHHYPGYLAIVNSVVDGPIHGAIGGDIDESLNGDKNGDKNGRPKGSLAHLRGIIRQDRLLDILSAQNLYATILASISDAVFLTDNSGNLTYVCPNVSIIFGYSETEVWEKQTIENFLGNLLDRPNADALVLEERGEITNLEHTVEDKTGQSHTLLINIKKVKIDHGTLLYTCRDITDRKQTETALQDLNKELEARVQERTVALENSEQRYRGLMDYAVDAIFLASLEGHLLECNRKGEELLGYSVSELQELTIWDIHPPEEYELVRQAFGVPLIETLVVCKTGAIKPVEISAGFLTINGETIVQGIFRDISARKQTEKELWQSQTKFQRLVEDIGDKFVIFSHTPEDGIFTYVSGGIEVISGQPKDAVLGKNWAECIDWFPESIELAKSHLGRLIKNHNAKVSFEMRFRRSDGSERIVSILEHSVRDPGGNLIAIEGLVEDITEAREAEILLRRLTDRLQLAAQAAKLGIWDWDIAQNRLIWDEEMYKIYGVEPSPTGKP